MPSRTVKETRIEIPPIDIRTMDIKVVSDSPLIMHRWGAPSRQAILDKMLGKAKTSARIAKDPVREFIDSMYWISGCPKEQTKEGFEAAIESGEAKFGFPSVAFKAAACAAGYRAKVMKDMVTMRGNLHIDDDFVEIEGVPTMREDIVRIANNAPDIRYRGEFPKWSATMTVKFNAGVVSDEQVVSLFNLGGFICGVGEWRPEKGGSFGMYHVV